MRPQSELLGIILPTRDFIRSLRRYDHLFSFYDGGIHRIVKELVMLSQGWLVSFYQDHQKTDALIRCIDEIIQQYEGSLHYRYLENTYRAGTSSSHMESILLEIDTEINCMMYHYLRDVPYEVDSFYKWIHDDLAIKVSRIPS